LQRGKELYCFEGHQGPVLTVAFSPDGRRILSAGGGRRKTSDNTLRIWSVAMKKEICRFGGHREAVRCAVFSPDGRTAATGSSGREYANGRWRMDNSVRIFGLPD